MYDIKKMSLVTRSPLQEWHLVSLSWIYFKELSAVHKEKVQVRRYFKEMKQSLTHFKEIKGTGTELGSHRVPM